MEIGGVIEWKSIDSRFVKDEVYEHISAPQWVDLSLTLTAPPHDHHDDEAWFCRPDCDHPKTFEDFFKQISPSSSPSPKRSAAASVSETIPPPPLLGEQRNQRDATLKKRVAVTRWDKIVAAKEEDSENRNPNLSTPPPNYNNKPKKKEAVKSSTEKTKTVDDENYRHQHKEERKMPNLRRTLSARNLFGGGEMLNKITEFCNELKKLTTRGGGAKEREDNTESNCSVVVDKEEKTPLLHIAKQKIRRKKKCNDDAENTIPISIDIKSSKQHQIRTYPPTPQCFSSTNRATPPKAFRSKPPMERGILQELAAAQSSSSNRDDANQDLHQDHARVRGKQHASIINPEKEAKSLDVFWFLKPCTL